MLDFLRAAKFMLLDLSSTIFFVLLHLLTNNTVLSVLLGSALGMIQIVTQLIRGRPVHSMEWMSLFLVVTAGSAAIATDDPRFVLFKPSVVYVIVGVVMLKAGWIIRYLPDVAKVVSSDVAIAVGYCWAALMFLSAAVNAVVAAACTVQTWAIIMPIFGIISKTAIFVGGFIAIRLTTKRRIRAMPADSREVLLATTGLNPELPAKSA